MAIQVETPDGNIAEFPDGMSQDAIAAVLRRQYPAPKEPKQTNAAVDVIRSIPGGLAKGVAAVAGIPGDISDALDAGANWLTGNNISSRPSVSAPSSGQLNAAFSAPTGGYYEPQRKAGRYAETIMSFLPAALAPGSAAARIARVALPGAGSEAAGQLAEDSGASPGMQTAARVAGGLAGGFSTALGRPIVRGANRATQALGGQGFLNPEAEAARRLTGAFGRDGGGNAAAGRANSFSRSGASAPSVLDVGGGNVSRLVRAAAGGGDEAQGVAQSYADQVRSNLQDNVISRTQQLPGPNVSNAQATAQARGAQRQQTAVDYAGPNATPVVLDDAGVVALRGDTGRNAIARARRDAEINNDTETLADLAVLDDIDAAAPPTVSGRALEAVRRAYGRLSEEAAAKPGGGYAQAGYLGRQEGLESTLDQAPGFAPARQNFRTNQAAIDAVPLGGRIMNAPSASYGEEIANLAGVGGPPNLRNLQTSAKNRIIADVEAPAEGATGILSKLGTSNRATANLASTFGDERAALFQEAVRNEVQRLRNANAVLPTSGSQTQLRGLDEALVDLPTSKAGIIDRAIGSVLRSFSLTPAERRAIVELATSPADLRRFATQPNTRFQRPAAAGAIGVSSTAND